ncbi:MAG TPA: hypothetical protein VFP65_11940 [Anaeromyxobacteraceae bacterium]|nr:hypothetical protein [Anaeromyxobacteraceae bacterium]
MGRVYTTVAARTAALAVALAASTSLACISFPRTTPEGDVTGAPPKPKDCEIAYLEKEPDRPYEELGEITDTIARPDPMNPAIAFRERACEMGADALIVTRRVVKDMFDRMLLSARAIRWKPEAKAADL